MSLVTPYIQKFQEIKRQIPFIANKAILDNRGTIVNLVRYGQLAKGLNSKGKSLSKGKGYSYATQAYADIDNIPVPKTGGQEYNFQWTSETFDNMFLEFVDFSNFTYEVETVKKKQELLEDIYGEIFDLTEEHNKWVNENIIEPAIIKYINTEISKL